MQLSPPLFSSVKKTLQRNALLRYFENAAKEKRIRLAFRETSTGPRQGPPLSVEYVDTTTNLTTTTTAHLPISILAKKDHPTNHSNVDQSGEHRLSTKQLHPCGSNRSSMRHAYNTTARAPAEPPSTRSEDLLYSLAFTEEQWYDFVWYQYQKQQAQPTVVVSSSTPLRHGTNRNQHFYDYYQDYYYRQQMLCAKVLLLGGVMVWNFYFHWWAVIWVLLLGCSIRYVSYQYGL
jgi:hypothetical protein